MKLKLVIPLFLLVFILLGCVRYSDGELVEDPKEEEAQDEVASSEPVEEDAQAEDDPGEIEAAKERKENDSQAAADVKKRVEEAKKANVKPATETPKVAESSLTPKEEITEIVVNELGAKTNMKNERIVSLTDMHEDGTYFVIALNGNENFTSSTTKRGLQLDAATILEPISQISEIQKVVIQWYLPLIDASGNEVDTQVMIVNIERDSLEEINWDNFDVENFEVVSETYFEHAALKE